MDTARQRRFVERWTYPVGTPVLARRDDGSTIDTRTTSEAWLLGGHTAVIMLDGISGCYALERVAVRP
jgi:hypothetical protein